MKNLLTLLVLCASIAQAQVYPIGANVVPRTTNTYDLGQSWLVWDSARANYFVGTTFNGYTLRMGSALSDTTKFVLYSDTTSLVAMQWELDGKYGFGDSPTFAFTISTDSLDVGNTATQGPGVLRLVNDEGQVARLRYLDAVVAQNTFTFPNKTGTVLTSDADQDASDLGDVTMDALTSGLINSQTISSAANFTGTVAIANYGVIGSTTASGGILFGGTKFRVEHAGTVAMELRNTSASSELGFQAATSGNTIGSDRILLFSIGGTRASIDASGNFGIGTITQLARLSINGGLHVGGDSDPGDNNALIDGTTTLSDTLIFNHRGYFALKNDSAFVIFGERDSLGRDNTDKRVRLAVQSYDVDQLPFVFLHGTSHVSGNNVAIGGGTSFGRPTTTIDLWTSASSTDSIGKLRARMAGGGVLTVRGEIEEDAGIVLATDYVSGQNSSRLFMSEATSANNGFSHIYAGDANPTFGTSVGNVAFTLTANRYYFIRHDGSTTGTWMYYAPRTSNSMVFNSTAISGVGSLTASGTVSSDSSFTINERSDTPSLPTSNTQMKMYMKGDKLIWVINAAGVPRFYYFDATATADQSIIYSATEP